MDRAQLISDVDETDQIERQILEHELIRRVCAGEKELYYELVRPYQRSVYLAAFAITRNEFDAEDVAQDALLKAFRALPTFRLESRFSTWLERIAVNEARMRLRRLRNHKSEPLNEEDTDSDQYIPLVLSDWREIPSEALERKEIRQMLRQALQQLPEMYREVILLRDVRQLSIAETAEKLGLTVANVKTRLLRARLRLRDLIAPMQESATITSRNPFQKGRKPW
jgi:RNA polymerase sigma-70 factor, ECF subfamily